MLVEHSRGLGFDGDAPFFLYLQLVEVLSPVALLDGAGELQQPVGERGLAVVDVRDDGEVPDPLRRVLPQLRRRHAGAGAVVRRRLGGQEALGEHDRPGGAAAWSIHADGAAGGPPERGGAGHAEPRGGAARRGLGF